MKFLKPATDLPHVKLLSTNFKLFCCITTDRILYNDEHLKSYAFHTKEHKNISALWKYIYYEMYFCYITCISNTTLHSKLG